MQKDVAILSTVINDELYKKSSQLFPKNIQTYVINGKNGMHGIFSLCYMMKKLKGKGIKWLIMADEDVLFVNPDCINAIINKMKTENYMVSGVRDGAVIPIRSYNPYVINTFFSIVNFEALEKIWNEREMLQNQYIEKNEFDDDLRNCPEKFDAVSLFEQYYCFYLWLRRKNQKILFLDATNPFSNDSISTLVQGLNGEILLYHTWYARSYGLNEKHTKRIDYIFSLIKFENKAVIKPIIFNERTFYWKQKIKKFKQKILVKIQ